MFHYLKKLQTAEEMVLFGLLIVLQAISTNELLALFGFLIVFLISYCLIVSV